MKIEELLGHCERQISRLSKQKNLNEYRQKELDEHILTKRLCELALKEQKTTKDTDDEEKVRQEEIRIKIVGGIIAFAKACIECGAVDEGQPDDIFEPLCREHCGRCYVKDFCGVIDTEMAKEYLDGIWD